MRVATIHLVGGQTIKVEDIDDWDIEAMLNQRKRTLKITTPGGVSAVAVRHIAMISVHDGRDA